MISFLVWAIQSLLDLYTTLIVIWCLLSWFPQAAESKIGEWLDRLVRPYIEIFDRWIPTLGGLSFSPIVAVLVLWLAQTGVGYLGEILVAGF